MYQNLPQKVVHADFFGAPPRVGVAMHGRGTQAAWAAGVLFAITDGTMVPSSSTS